MSCARQVRVLSWLILPIALALSPVALAQTIPSSQPAESPAMEHPNAPTDDAGRKLIQFIIEKDGGAGKLAGIRSFRMITATSGSNGSGGFDAEVTVELPDRMKQVTTIGANRTVTIFSPAGAFMSLNGQPARPIPGGPKQHARNETHSTMIYILQHPDSPDLQLHDGGTQAIGTVHCRVLIIGEPDGRSAQWFIDSASGRIMRIITTLRAGQAIHHATSDFTAWQTIDGIEFPTGGSTASDSRPRGHSRSNTS